MKAIYVIMLIAFSPSWEQIVAQNILRNGSFELLKEEVRVDSCKIFKQNELSNYAYQWKGSKGSPDLIRTDNCKPFPSSAYHGSYYLGLVNIACQFHAGGQELSSESVWARLDTTLSEGTYELSYYLKATDLQYSDAFSKLQNIPSQLLYSNNLKFCLFNKEQTKDLCFTHTEVINNVDWKRISHTFSLDFPVNAIWIGNADPALTKLEGANPRENYLMSYIHLDNIELIRLPEIQKPSSSKTYELIIELNNYESNKIFPSEQELQKLLNFDFSNAAILSISIYGYASSKGDNDYNKDLSQKRIKHLVNEIKRTTNNKIEINEYPLGESQSNVEDLVDDRKVVIKVKLVTE